MSHGHAGQSVREGLRHQRGGVNSKVHQVLQHSCKQQHQGLPRLSVLANLRRLHFLLQCYLQSLP